MLKSGICRRVGVVVGAALIASLAAGAAVQEVTLMGTLTDNLSVDQGGLLKHDDPEGAAGQLSPGDLTGAASVESGFALIRGKVAIKFDAASNKRVLEYLNSPNAELKVRVTGTQTPNGFALKEIRARSVR